MLNDKDAVANVAVKDMKVAKKFYEETLGLKQVGSMGDDLINFKSGNSVVNVYKSEFAGTNKATSVTWLVGNDIEAIAKGLKNKGVTFEHYDMPGLTLEGDVHVGYGMKVAWFRDPDGNIHNIVDK